MATKPTLQQLIRQAKRKRFRAGHGKCQTCTRVCTGRKYLYRFEVRNLATDSDLLLCYRCWRAACLFKGSPSAINTFASRFWAVHRERRIAEAPQAPAKPPEGSGGKQKRYYPPRRISGPKLSNARREQERLEALKALAGPTCAPEAALS